MRTLKWTLGYLVVVAAVIASVVVNAGTARATSLPVHCNCVAGPSYSFNNIYQGSISGTALFE